MLPQTASTTSCLLAFHSLNATAPLVRPEPLPLLAKATWSVAGEARTWHWR